jgi:hypothetical protein
MAEPLLTEIFGAGATQTATSLTILKAGITGLTPQSANTAESLLVAILVRAMLHLSPANAANNPNQSASIVRVADTLITQGGGQIYTINLLTSLRRSTVSTGVVPDAY